MISSASRVQVRIATRQSPLALWQARHVSALLTQWHPQLEVVLVEMTTEGDRFLQAPLSSVGGKGLFVKEIEQALLDGRADIAVHSLKDMTSLLPDGLMLAALPVREDPRDAFVSPQGFRVSDVPSGHTVGTSSLRRMCQLLARRPDLHTVSVRGNVQSRLRKTKEAGWAGTLLALAGLKRLGLASEVSEILEVEDSLPAVGQGVLAIQCRSQDARVRQWLEPLDHAATRHVVTAERAFLARLEGGCTVPLAGYAVLEGNGDRLWLRGLIGSPDGKRMVRGETRGAITDAAQLGTKLAETLLNEGGREILEAYAHQGLGKGA